MTSLTWYSSTMGRKAVIDGVGTASTREARKPLSSTSPINVRTSSVRSARR